MNDDDDSYNDKKLFVGNLSFAVTNTDLANLFKPVCWELDCFSTT